MNEYIEILNIDMLLENIRKIVHTQKYFRIWTMRFQMNEKETTQAWISAVFV
jgi:hypothetical protein